MTPHTTGDPQHMDALRIANSVRLARAEHRRELHRAVDRRSSRERCAELILEPPHELESMATIDLLLSCRGVGHRAATRMLTQVQIGHSRRIGELASVQRERLAARLSQW